MARGKETIFLTELKHSFNEEGHFAIKIGDTPPSLGMRFTTQKEFDMIVCVNGSSTNGETRQGSYMAIEAKFLSSMRAFGPNQMRDHQCENLDKVVDAGGEAFVFLNVRFKGDKEKNIKRTNRCYIFRWQNLKKYWEENKTIRGSALKDMEYFEGKLKRFNLRAFTPYIEVWNGLN